MAAYVYELLDASGVVCYVGKGSGSRLERQMAKFKLSGRIWREFSTDKAAYEAERKRIAELSPALNRCAGGNGPRRKRVERQPKWLREIEAVGTRVYAARLLLALRVCPDSKVETIREIAYGSPGRNAQNRRQAEGYAEQEQRRIEGDDLGRAC